jgi:hypothetical protein
MSKFNPQPKEGPKPKKEKKPLRRTAIKKKFKVTGEKNVFHEVLDGLSDMEETKCFVCQIPIALVTHCNFGHVLSKGKYSKFRLNPDNIVLLCHRIIADDDGSQGCHHSWDFKPRSELTGEGWERIKELEAELKEHYKNLEDEVI